MFNISGYAMFSNINYFSMHKIMQFCVVYPSAPPFYIGMPGGSDARCDSCCCPRKLKPIKGPFISQSYWGLEREYLTVFIFGVNPAPPPHRCTPTLWLDGAP